VIQKKVALTPPRFSCRRTSCPASTTTQLEFKPPKFSSRSHFPSYRPEQLFTMISGILIFNQKGENLIFRSFRSDCRPRLADIFRIQVISNVNVRSPILTLGSTTFSHIRHENIYLVAVTKSNANAALVFEFLERLRALGKSYFGKFDEEAVKNNFVLVYELLDGTYMTPGTIGIVLTCDCEQRLSILDTRRIRKRRR
jgi:hypothetical protein